MRASLRRLRCSMVTDLRVRFRRTSTAVTFLLLCLSSYFLIPDPSTGRTLMTFGGQRVFYNSAAIAMSTVLLCSLLLSLAGFYLVSNAIRRDVDARTGFILAATVIRNREYLLARFLGNAFFLLALGVGFMLSAMAMYLVRGEAPLEPVVFLLYYAVVLVPTVVVTAAIALCFEAVRPLSGKIGDVTYFFVWMLTMATAAATVGSVTSSLERPHWSTYVDVQGLGFVIEQVKLETESDSFTIGHNAFDQTLPPIHFGGLHIRPVHVLARLCSALISLPLLGLALLSFHRFDPARLQVAHSKGRRGWIGHANRRLKPLISFSVGLLGWGHSSRPLARAVLTELWLTVVSYPLVPILAFGFAITAILLPDAALHRVLLPLVFLVLIPVLADVPCRETRQRTTALVFACPSLKSCYVWWKLAVSFVLVLCFVGVPLLRAALAVSPGFPALLVGCLFWCTSAVALGLLSGSSKPFIMSAMLFWYLALSDQGRTPAVDFAGWYSASSTTMVAYLVLAAVLAFIAVAFHSWRLRADRV
jgi:hypothetical protein